MGLVQCFVLMLSAQLVLTFPPVQRTYTLNGKRCYLCNAGEYQVSCTECAPCPAGRYTSELNRERQCHRCFGDCSPDYHLKAVRNCSSTSDVKCECQDGFRCIDKVPFSENCRQCVKIQAKTTTVAAAATVVISAKDKQTPSSTSSGYSSTSSKPCRLSECGLQSVQAQNTSKPEKSHAFLGAVLCSVFLLGCLALMIPLCLRRSRDNIWFSQTIAKLCKEKGQDAARRSMDSSHQFPRDSFSAKQQPPTLSAANMGPVHVHNPGTIIFSYLSEFSGQVGPTIKGGNTPERRSREEEDVEEEEEEEEEEEGNCPVCHPISPHLSEEEKNEESDSIFIPSQEQGKDYHMSKEEVL